MPRKILKRPAGHSTPHVRVPWMVAHRSKSTMFLRQPWFPSFLLLVKRIVLCLKMFRIQSRFTAATVKNTIAAQCRTIISQVTGERTPHVKHKIPVKRASKLLNELRQEEYETLKNGRKWPEFRAGDAIEIEKLPFMTAPKANIIKGVVIGISRKASATNIKLLNNENGAMVYRIMPMYNPLIKNIRVIQKAFIHKGKKRVRRSKLYYLMDRHPDEYTVL